MKATTPPWPPAGPLKRFCRELSHAHPVLIPYTKVDDRYRSKYCHTNVRHRVYVDGGRAEFGWVVWYSPFLTEAEFHCVWLKDGQMFDVTPRVDGETDVVFIPERRGRKFRLLGAGLMSLWTNHIHWANGVRQPTQIMDGQLDEVGRDLLLDFGFDPDKAD